MSQKVIIIDTSMLNVWLDTQNTTICVLNGETWDKDRLDRLLEEEKMRGTTFVLPLATIIEAGNQIAQAAERRYERAQSLAKYMIKAADGKSPWALFTDQSVLWTSEALKELAQNWPTLAAKQLSMADATIKKIAEYYNKKGYEVVILTCDSGLKAYEPS